MYNTDVTGALTDSIQTIQHYGSSVNKNRQASPHVHACVVSASQNYLYVPDLGIDKVMIYHFDPFSGKIDNEKPKFYQSKAGSGPRHISFHPTLPTTYLMEELSGTVAVLKVKKNGALKLTQNISSHTKDFKGVIGSADIHVSPNGKFLYASNRGEANTIAIFSVNQKNGKLINIGHQSVFGKKPRNFNFSPDGKFLLVANQDSDEIVVFKIDTFTGLLTDTGNRIKVPNPVCIAWAIE
jgi:6-phosphogluconolactonase